MGYDDIVDKLRSTNNNLDSADTLGERLTYWAEWCFLWDMKEELEEAERVKAKEYEL